ACHPGAFQRTGTDLLQVLGETFLDPKSNYLWGDAITIADYQAVSYVVLAEAVASDLAAYPTSQTGSSV
ncbi:MAG: hypothetical protein ABI343_15150, partial [Burkholderiaceae bacterium]